MQRVCRTEGGVKSYLENPRSLIQDESRRCPLCPDGHRLRLHGTYLRQALFPHPEAPESIPIQRLLCVRKGRTVSLLPDFCLPRRQHGPSILGLFLQALLHGVGLLEALNSVRRDVTHHSTAGSLLSGFQGRARKIQTYLARFRSRIIKSPGPVPSPLRSIAILVEGLLEGFQDLETAFTFHARRFHRCFQVGLA